MFVVWLYFQKRRKGRIYEDKELADETHVSTSTILRFCRKVDCAGYSEFKVKLKMYISEEKHVKFKSTQHSLSEFVERTLKGSFESYIQETARYIAKAESVIFLGIGSSGIMAEYGSRYVSSLGKSSLYIKDPFFQSIQVFKQQCNDCLECVWRNVRNH